MANLIGLLVLADFMIIPVFTVPATSANPMLWGFIYIAGAISAFYFWNHKSNPVTPTGWIRLAIGTGILGTLLFTIDIVIGYFQYPELPLLIAGTKAGGAAGFIITLAVCPGMTAIAISGAVRFLFSEEKS
jgi:tryptophan-rich sensory protein